jgi:2-amino-4-hydroxy-6-hydroxymethyldihydropteridine diphosphokinase
MSRALIGLGSNIDPEKNLREAARMLREIWPEIRFSSVFRTAPREREDQPDFLNAVAVAETNEAPDEVLRALERIERALKKAPPFRFGPRTIDLDLLLYDDRVQSDASLTLPHPRMHERRFVLEPLLELVEPHATHPVLKRSWQDLLDQTSDQECTRTGISL